MSKLIPGISFDFRGHAVLVTGATGSSGGAVAEGCAAEQRRETQLSVTKQQAQSAFSALIRSKTLCPAGLLVGFTAHPFTKRIHFSPPIGYRGRVIKILTALITVCACGSHPQEQGKTTKSSLLARLRSR